MIFRVQIGSGSSADCSDFSATGTLYNDAGMRATSQTLAAFTTTRNSWATGVGDWAASPGTSRAWRLEWIVWSDDAARGQSTSFLARWEAQR